MFTHMARTNVNRVSMATTDLHESLVLKPEEGCVCVHVWYMHVPVGEGVGFTVTKIHPNTLTALAVTC